jgi:AcrR family transcriptional regulator
VFTKNTNRGRGRPPGRTAEGEATRERLYRTALRLIHERGYDAATLREVARRAGVSVALLYRYFPNKRAVVLALYDELSETLERQASMGMPGGRWRDRFDEALSLSLGVLAPHRVTLRALAPLIVSDGPDGIFSAATAFSRRRVQATFERAVTAAADAPRAALAPALGRLLYLGHLGVILWWLLDRSPSQRATTALLEAIRRILPAASLALRLSPVQTFVLAVDRAFVEGLLGGEAAANAPAAVSAP